MDRRGLTREPDRSPALTGAAAGAESQGAPGAKTDERNLGSRWLISAGSELRSFLGIAALLVFVLPAVVLVLTLLGNDNKPVSMKMPTERDGGSAVTHKVQTEGGERSGEGEMGDRFPVRHDRSSRTSSEDEGVGPALQTGQDQAGAQQAQDAPVTVAAVPATPTADAAGSPEPVSSAAASSAPASSVAASSVPVAVPADGSGEVSTAPAASVPSDTAPAPTNATQPAPEPAESAPPVAQQASPLDPSAPAIAGGMPTPSEVPARDYQDVAPQDRSYDQSEYD